MNESIPVVELLRLPEWLKPSKGSIPPPELGRWIKDRKLSTVCESAGCPNRKECYGQRTATFMILGDVCTRRCTFCGVSKGSPSKPDPDEPRRVAEAVRDLGLAHAVITSVTRDDLEDGGALAFAETVRRLREFVREIVVELLVPDFNGNAASARTIFEAGPDIFGHNLETVPSLYADVRPGADYRRSLDLLEKARQIGFRTKTGLMLGLGESVEELNKVFSNLAGIGCGILTLGQYLRPTRDSRPVSEYVPPEKFESIRKEALASGLRQVIAGPRIRSSYHAAEAAL